MKKWKFLTILGLAIVAAGFALSAITGPPAVADPVAGNRLTMTKDDLPVFWPPRGQVFYVCSVIGSATATGRSPVIPLTTIEAAVNKCSASRGDIILVLPGHNEGAGAAAIFDADIAGVSIIGLGNGSLRPRLDYDNAAAVVTIGANNVTLKNLVFRPSVTAVLIGVDVETGVTGTVIEDCEFAIGEDGAGVDEFVKAIHLTSGNHDTVIRNNRILAHASAAQATHAIHIDAASDRLIIEGNAVMGPYATAGILEDAAGTEHVVQGNTFNVSAANVYGLHASSTFARFMYEPARAIERCLEKSDGAVLNGQDSLFVVSGGPVLAQVTGIVTTVIGGAANCHIDHTTVEPAADVALSTDVAIDNDAAGTSYRFVGATGVLTPDTNGAKIIDPVTVGDCWFLLPIGTLKAHCSGAQTGNVKWYLRYKPLSPLSQVTVAP